MLLMTMIYQISNLCINYVCINKLCMNKNFSILDQIGLVQADHERQPPPEILIENKPMPRPGIRAVFNE